MTINRKFAGRAFTKSEFQAKRINPDTEKPFSDRTIYSELNGLIIAGILEMTRGEGSVLSYRRTGAYERAPPAAKRRIIAYLKTLPARPDDDRLEAAERHIRSIINPEHAASASRETLGAGLSAARTGQRREIGRAHV